MATFNVFLEPSIPGIQEDEDGEEDGPTEEGTEEGGLPPEGDNPAASPTGTEGGKASPASLRDTPHLYSWRGHYTCCPRYV